METLAVKQPKTHKQVNPTERSLPMKKVLFSILMMAIGTIAWGETLPPTYKPLLDEAKKIGTQLQKRGEIAKKIQTLKSQIPTLPIYTPPTFQQGEFESDNKFAERKNLGTANYEKEYAQQKQRVVQRQEAIQREITALDSSYSQVSVPKITVDSPIRRRYRYSVPYGSERCQIPH